MSIHQVDGYLHTDPYNHDGCDACKREIGALWFRFAYSYVPVVVLLIVPLDALKVVVLPAIWYLIAQNMVINSILNQQHSALDGTVVGRASRVSGLVADDEDEVTE